MLLSLKMTFLIQPGSSSRHSMIPWRLITFLQYLGLTINCKPAIFNAQICLSLFLLVIYSGYTLFMRTYIDSHASLIQDMEFFTLIGILNQLMFLQTPLQTLIMLSSGTYFADVLRETSHILTKFVNRGSIEDEFLRCLPHSQPASW